MVVQHAFHQRHNVSDSNVQITFGHLYSLSESQSKVTDCLFDPDQIHTPGIFVQRIMQGTGYVKPIEQRTTRPLL